jgi:hypothetical protein
MTRQAPFPGTFRGMLPLVILGLPAPTTAAEGQLTWAVRISPAPDWFDPAERPSSTAGGIELGISLSAHSRPPWLTTITDNAPYGPVLQFTLPVGGTRVP